eukprot:GHVU01099346.1.p1 GENE.GHVU01099346.1~~GHVU01099346.1.p1  ORF type:complete len:1737 (+),score=226.63 GHVU01099346.1:171-5381(+)
MTGAPPPYNVVAPSSSSLREGRASSSDNGAGSLGQMAQIGAHAGNEDEGALSTGVAVAAAAPPVSDLTALVSQMHLLLQHVESATKKADMAQETANKAMAEKTDQGKGKDALDQREVDKLLKAIKAEKFGPSSEGEYDDTLDKWERLANGRHHDWALIKQAVLRLATPVVEYALEHYQLMQMDWEKFRNELAKALYPYSTQIEDVERWLESRNRESDSLTTGFKYIEKMKRFERLCERWDRSEQISNHKKKEYYIRKLPVRVEEKVRELRWQDWTFDEVLKESARLESVIKELTRIREGESGAANTFMTKLEDTVQQGTNEEEAVAPDGRFAGNVSSQMESTEGSIFAAPAATTEAGKGKDRTGAGPSRTCTRCHNWGHSSEQCRTDITKRCAWCKKLGHDEANCSWLVVNMPTKFAPNRTALIPTKGGVLIKPLELTKVEQLRAIATHFSTMAERVESAQRRFQAAQARRQASTEEGGVSKGGSYHRDQSLAEARMSFHSSAVEGLSWRNDVLEWVPEDTTTEAEGSDRSALRSNLATTAHSAAKPCWYAWVRVADCMIEMLVDPGSQVNLIAGDDVERFRKSGLDIDSRDEVPRAVKGVGGKIGIPEVVTLPTQLTKQLPPSFETMLVNEEGHNLLGAPFLDGADCRMTIKTGLLEMGVHSGNVTKVWLHRLGDEDGGLQSAKVIVDRAEALRATISDDLGEQEKEQAFGVLKTMEDYLFDFKMGACTVGVHDIDVGDAKPIRAARRKHSPWHQDVEEENAQMMLAAGGIERSHSAWSSPSVIVPKADGTFRVCQDFRGLNAVTKPDAFPMPRVEEILATMAGAKWITKIDIRKGYNQIRLTTRAKELTAFRTRSGLYHGKVMLFGLRNGGETFQRVINEVLDPVKAEGVSGYIDDIVVPTKRGTFEDHLQLVLRVLKLLCNAGLYVNLEKLQVGLTSVVILGHIVDGSGYRPDPAKVASIVALRQPGDRTSLRRFLGACNFYRKFIEKHAALAKPLTNLLRDDEPWQWGQAQEAAFKRLKEALTTKPVLLAFPRPDWEFVMDTDASGHTLSAVLQQRDPQGLYYVLGYASKTLNDTEVKYHAQEREAYAIVWGMRHYEDYFRPTTVLVVRTDCESLKHVWSAEKGRLARWAMDLQRFTFRIEYRSGKSNKVADLISRDINMTAFESEMAERIAPDFWRYASGRESTNESGVSKRTPAGLSGDAPNLESEGQEETKAGGPSLRGVDGETPHASVGNEGEIVRVGTVEAVEAFEGHPPEGQRSQEAPDEGAEGTAVTETGSAEATTRKLSGLNLVFPTPSEFMVAQEKEGEEYLLGLGLAQTAGLWCTKTGQVYVAKSLRDPLMTYYHYGATGAHQGVTRTRARCARMFWWPHMQEAIQEFNNSCLVCNRRRPKFQPGQAGGDLVSDGPLEMVAIDLVGPFQHKGREAYIVSIIDHFTKFADATVINDKKGETIWAVFLAKWLAYFGVCKVLLSDNAKELSEGFFAERLKECGIKQAHSSPYNPTGNGTVESWHQFLVRSLAAMRPMLQARSLEECVGWVVFAYRSTPHPVTGELPAYLHMALDPELPCQRPWRGDPERDPRNRLELVDKIRAAALVRMIEAAAKRKERLPKKEIKVGDTILYSLAGKEQESINSLYGAAKWAPKWSEPCRVVQFVNESRTTVKVVSLWYKGRSRHVSLSIVRKLPTMVEPHVWMARRELEAEMRRHIELGRKRPLEMTEGEIEAGLKRLRGEST